MNTYSNFAVEVDERAWLYHPDKTTRNVVVASVPAADAYVELGNPHKGWHNPVHLERAAKLVLSAAPAAHTTETPLRVLDVGCGFGQLWSWLQTPLGARGRYTGVDCSRAMIAQGRARYPQQEFVVGAAEALPLPDKSADVTVCWDVLIHLKSMMPALRELLRVTRQLVVLQVRTGTTESKRMVYDPARRRLFKHIVEGYVYYNILTAPGLNNMLAHVGITDYETERLGNVGGHGCYKTVVWFSPPGHAIL